MKILSDILIAIILGIVEGLTEFIPVSSTGHLIIVGEALTFTQANADTFNIAIQLGAILAAMFLFKDYFISYRCSVILFITNSITCD